MKANKNVTSTTKKVLNDFLLKLFLEELDYIKKNPCKKGKCLCHPNAQIK